MGVSPPPSATRGPPSVLGRSERLLAYESSKGTRKYGTRSRRMDKFRGRGESSGKRDRNRYMVVIGFDSLVIAEYARRRLVAKWVAKYRYLDMGSYI